MKTKDLGGGGQGGSGTTAQLSAFSQFEVPPASVCSPSRYPCIFRLDHTPYPPWISGINDIRVDMRLKLMKVNGLTVKILITQGLWREADWGARQTQVGRGNLGVSCGAVICR